jgi:superfamily II DNA or RNA helicase
LEETRPERFKFKFKDHQQEVIDYCANLPPKSNQRGVLLYHTLGLGKTCTSIGIADRLLQETGEDGRKRFDQVMIFLPAALRSNFVKEYCTKCGKAHARSFHKLFTFYAYNDSGVLDKLPDRIDRAVVIVDEIHNLLAGRRNRSRIKSYVFGRIRQATNSFVIGLSGTPIYGSTFELALLMRLLKRRSGLPTSRDDWQRLVEQQPEDVVRVVKNTISYVEPSDFRDYPRVNFDRFVMTPMSLEQREEHDRQMEKEDAILKKRRGGDRSEEDRDFIVKISLAEDETGQKSSSLEYLALTRFFSRRVSLLVYPPKKLSLLTVPLVFRKRFPDLNDLVDWLYQLNAWTLDREEKSEFMRSELQKVLLPNEADRAKLLGWDLKRRHFDRDPTLVKTDAQLMVLSQAQLERHKSNSSIAMFALRQLKERYSPKLYQLYRNISTLEGKHVIYSQFKENYGLYAISTFLTLRGIPNLCYTGDQNEQERDEILRLFNSPDNLDGSEWRVLLLSDAGVEGLSIMATEYIHIMSPQIIQNRLNQVIGRIRRLGSHKDLPEERQSVGIFRYMSVLNPDFYNKEFDAVNCLDANYEEVRDHLLKNVDPSVQESSRMAQAKGEKFDWSKVVVPPQSVDQMITESSLERERGIQKVLELMKRARLEDRDDDDDAVSTVSSTVYGSDQDELEVSDDD